MDFCTGDWSLSGALWAGVEVEAWLIKIKFGQEWSATIASGNRSDLKWFNCGQCASECADDWFSIGLKIPLGEWKKEELKGKKKKKATLWVVECSIEPNLYACKADFQVGCSANLLGLIPGAGTITKALKYIGAEAEIGIQGSFTLGLCVGAGSGSSGGGSGRSAMVEQRRKPIEIVAYSAEFCIGGYIEVGWGLGEKKKQMEKKKKKGGKK